jgi:WXXGXW repeat (2 copies)
MTSVRIFAVLIGGFTLLWTAVWPSTPASAQVVERGVEGAAVGAIIGGIVGGGRGAGTGAAIGAGVGVLSGAAEANARAHGYYGPPPGYYRPPPPGYYRPPPPAYYRPPPPAGVGLSVSIAPPVLPVYEQPLCPGPGYIWTPGYWGYGDVGYYWVPGTWVFPPAVGLLWTPGYWGDDGGAYVWHAGYWGPHVGYYGGINYGFGYFGVGYEGGYWDNGAFFYNTAVTKVNRTVITHTYNKTVIKNVTVNNVSFNGGRGGTKAQPTAQELAWSRERRTPQTALQRRHQQTASTNRELFASVNDGTPPVAATAKPGVFTGPETVGSKGRKGTDKTTVATSTPSQTSPDRPEQRTDQKAIPHGAGGSNDALAREGPRPTGSPNGPGGPRDPGASRHYAAPRGEDGNGGPGHYDRREGPRGKQGPGGPGGPGPYAGPHGPGGPQGGGQVAQGGPRSDGKQKKHDQEIGAEQPR